MIFAEIKRCKQHFCKNRPGTLHMTQNISLLGTSSNPYDIIITIVFRKFFDIMEYLILSSLSPQSKTQNNAQTLRENTQ